MNQRLEQITSQNVKQIQRLILSPQLQQALHLLQLPVLELSSFIEEELVQNPLLELADKESPTTPTPPRQAGYEGADRKAFVENTLAYESSLFEHLMAQATETFLDKKELELARWIIGYLDSDGLLSTPLEEIALFAGCELFELTPILKEIQTFDPAGVAAQSGQQALLIQLKRMDKERSLAFRIVEKHFEDVLHNRIPLIAKALLCSTEQVRKAVLQDIAPLDLHPGSTLGKGHYKSVSQNLIPDLTIQYAEQNFSILINDENLPPLRITDSYLEMLKDKMLPEQTRQYIEEKISSSQWLLRNVRERHQTLYRIAEKLIETQGPFLSDPKGALLPLTMKETAEVLELHESTIARAVANKYVNCPRGILPLRSFFTHGYTTDRGDAISAQTVKDVLLKILSEENKKRPLSDEAISQRIKERGIECARRTVAKYRCELKIGNTSQRKIH